MATTLRTPFQTWTCYECLYVAVSRRQPPYWMTVVVAEETKPVIVCSACAIKYE